MPNIKSQIKRVKTNKKANLRNASKMSALNTSLKKAAQAIEDKSSEMEELYNDAIKKLDMAESKNLLHKNNIARKKSKLTKAFNKANS